MWGVEGWEWVREGLGQWRIGVGEGVQNRCKLRRALQMDC